MAARKVESFKVAHFCLKAFKSVTHLVLNIFHLIWFKYLVSKRIEVMAGKDCIWLGYCVVFVNASVEKNCENVQ